MTRNLIWNRRKALGVTQRQLAQIVGTSQQQVQRIESGAQAVRLELAISIAEALQSSLSELFPSIDKQTRRRRLSKPASSETEQRRDERFRKAGIDPDPAEWTLKFDIKGVGKRLFPVASSEKDRISEIIWRGDFDFLVFDSRDKRVAIRLENVNYCNVLFDFGIVHRDESEPEYKVEARFKENDNIIFFGVEPQAPSKINEGGDLSELARLFMELEAGVDRNTVLSFVDEDGELVLIRAENLIFFEAPLICVLPRLWESALSEYEEQEDGNTASKEAEK